MKNKIGLAASLILMACGILLLADGIVGFIWGNEYIHYFGIGLIAVSYILNSKYHHGYPRFSKISQYHIPHLLIGVSGLELLIRTVYYWDTVLLYPTQVTLWSSIAILGIFVYWFSHRQQNDARTILGAYSVSLVIATGAVLVMSSLLKMLGSRIYPAELIRYGGFGILYQEFLASILIGIATIAVGFVINLLFKRQWAQTIKT